MIDNIKSFIAKLPVSTKIGLIIVFLFCILALIAPYVAPYDPHAMDFKPFLRPSAEHLLGTDNLGRDIFSQLLCASRVSLPIGIVAATVVVLIGFTVGIWAGYRGGIAENILMGITDVFILIPGLPLMIIIATYLGPSVWNVILVVAILWWCGTARLVYSRTVQVKEMSFIESARMMGFRESYILFRHILSNVKEIFVARWCLSVASAMMAEAGLAFLGLGDPFEISWGGMITAAFNKGGFVLNLWWWYVAPGIMISLITAGFFLIGMKKKMRRNVWDE
jgi:peptide/nickel transport system permease protein